MELKLIFVGIVIFALFSRFIKLILRNVLVKIIMLIVEIGTKKRIFTASQLLMLNNLTLKLLEVNSEIMSRGF